jgi:hypothetical protein
MRTISSGTAWRAFSSVLLLVFLLRAAIPAGFMPARGDGQGGMPGMTFCIAGLPAGVSQSPTSGKSETPAEPQALHCIFSVATSQGALLLAAPSLMPANQARRIGERGQGTRTAPRRAGPASARSSLK